MMKNDMKEKEEVIMGLKHLWGPIFIKSYIPMLQRPLIQHNGGYDIKHFNKSYESYEWRPQKWDLPVLKAILVIAKLTSDKRLVRNIVEDVVNYRIKNTDDHTSHITVADCEVIGIMLDKHWGTECAFKMHQENSLIDRKEQDRPGEESKHKIDVSQVFDDDSDVDPKSKEAGSDASKKAGHEFGANAKQRGIREASGKAQPKGNHTQKNAAETSSSVSRGEKQKKRNHAAIEDELPGMNSLSTGRNSLARDHASGQDHTGYDICSSSPSLNYPSSPPRSSRVERGNGNKSRYGMFPPLPPPRATTPPAQDTSEPQRHRDENHSNTNKNTGSRTKSTPDCRKDSSNTQFENNGYNNDDDQDEDEDDDQNVLNAKLAAAEAAFNLAQLRVAAAEFAARKTKKARTAGSSRGNSTSSS